ncbi:MAG: hypothetical protein U9O96_07700 [Candidatus Thermoplasmatota archaeon]|nr:hypothetical protein [Candidatus Thermoplasmatota archaeon]
MKGTIRALRLISLAVVVSILLIPSFQISESRTQKTVYKNIAVYPSIIPAIKVLEYSLQYGWTIDGIHYQFNVSELSRREAMGKGIKPLNTENYDVLAIGASARQYIHGIDTRWKENVRKFVADGGGYVGICGGANEASQGMPNPSTLIDRIIDAGALGIANVYINDDQDEEWQYLYKTSGMSGGVPIACNFSNHPIVSVSPNNPRLIRYEGGPSMYLADKIDPLLGDVIPLATYAEEISEKAPIHFWKKVGGGWQIEAPISTDVKGQYAAIATTYGNGRVALFGPHPEEPASIGGHVEEFLGRSKYALFKEDYLYRWADGQSMDWSYNWWMLRRAAAWAAGIPDEHLPPIDDMEIFLVEPSALHPALYINGRHIMPAPWGTTLIGKMPFTIYINENSTVNFYLDGKKYYSDNSPPYVWTLDMPMVGKHDVHIEVVNTDAMAYAQICVYAFNTRMLEK